MNKELLLKYLNNNCSNEEFEEFVEWVKGNAHNKESKYWSFDQWLMFEPELNEKDKKKYSALLDKIHHEINLQHTDKKEDKTILIKNISKWVSRAAAILFIPLLGVIFYLLSNNNIQTEKLSGLTLDSVEVIAPIGSRTVVQLSDGTEVTLNYGSKIKYPRIFTGDTREIILTGEGYFNVAHNPDKPFIVKAGELYVTALGTEFNVQSYPGDEIVSTTLVKGKIVIDRIMPNEKINRIGIMEPDQHLEYNMKSGITISSKGNIYKYTAWKDGKMVFDNAPITEVAQELSRRFNVDIEIADNIKDLTYTVTFIDDPLFLILDLMTETTPVEYHRFPRRKLADGTYSKQIIRIEKRN